MLKPFIFYLTILKHRIKNIKLGYNGLLFERHEYDLIIMYLYTISTNY